MGLPPFSLVTASSEAVLSGYHQPGEAIFGPGTFSQFIPVGRSHIDAVSVLLLSRGPGPAKIPARAYASEPPEVSGSAPLPGRLLKETTLFWNGNGLHWIDWEVKLTPLSGMKVGHYTRLELDLPEGVAWTRNKDYDPVSPGTYGESKANPAFPPDGATFCFRISPDQPCFWAVNILPETAGSNRFTGAWKSDPADGLPQWIDVSWKDPLLIEALDLEFPDSPECPLSYRIEVSVQNGEPHIVQVDQNDSQRPAHEFAPPISGDRVRVIFFSTRGSPSVSTNCIQVRRYCP